jgi:hypothetical protein
VVEGEVGHGDKDGVGGGGGVEVVYCADPLADDVIVGFLDNLHQQPQAGLTAPPPPLPGGRVGREQRGSSYSVASESATAAAAVRAAGAEAVVVVTADKGLMGRCLDRGAMVMKCGPLLRMANQLSFG